MTRKRHVLRITFFGLIAASSILSWVMPIEAAAGQLKGLKTVEVVGSSPISDSGPAAAREQAIANSLDAAVNQVVADEIPADTFATSPEAIAAALSGKAQSFIENYKVLEASETEEGYQVVVEVTVSVPGIKKELNRAGIHPDAKALPKVLFLTSQQNLDDVVPQYWWSGSTQEPDLIAESAMIKGLKEKGFFIISNQDPMARAAAASDRYTPNLDNRQAADFGARIGADVVVVGQSAAQATPRQEGKTIRSFKATSSLRAIIVDSAVELASASEEFVADDSDDPAGGRNALAGAGAAAGKTLAAKLYSAWVALEKAASFVRLEVEGTHALADFVRFREALKETRGVDEVRIEVLRPDSAVVTVGFDGDAETLARALTASGYGSFNIHIYEIKRNGISLELMGKTGTTASQ